MTVYLFLPLAALLINVILTPLALLGHMRERSHQTFSIFLISMALWGGALFLTRSSNTPEAALFWEGFVLVNFALMAASYLHFSQVCADGRSYRWIVPVAYGLVGVVALVAFSGLIVSQMERTFYGYAPAQGALWPFYLVFVYSCALLSLKNICSVYQRPTSQSQRNRAGYLILGTALALACSITDHLPLTGVPTYPLGLVGYMLLAMLASVALLQSRLLDIRMALRRAMGFLLVISFMGGLYVLVSFVLHLTVGTDFLTLSIAISIGLMVLGYVTLSPLLDRVQDGFERLFYRRRWEPLQDLYRFTTETKNITDLNLLARSVVLLVKRAMEADPVLLMMPVSHNDPEWSTAGVGTGSAPPLPITCPGSWLKGLAKYDRAYLAEEMFALPDWHVGPSCFREPMEAQGIHLFVPLKCRGELTGLLLLGAKTSGGAYSLEEIELLEAVALHAAASIENARLYEELKLQLKELKETQAHLVRSGKLASVGTLAAGVAHEVNNPVFAITGMTELLLSNPESHFRSSQAQEYVTVIAEMSDRIAKVVKGMLVYSRQDGTPSMVNLNQVAEDTLRLVGHRLAARGITIRREYQPELPPIEAVANQLQQVLMNLILNANDAMGESDVLTVRTGVEDGRVLLSCADTGGGIPPENVDRIFDAFFTTKPEGKGTGLGLHITHRIIQDWGGEIRVQSQVGVGTTFTIYMPMAPTGLDSLGLEEIQAQGGMEEPVAGRS